MTQNKVSDDMPIWQNHENRITTLEVTMTGLTTKMDKVESTIREGNKEQKDMLDKINNRIMEEFFHKKRVNLSNSWKLVLVVSGSLVGGGSFLYVLFEKFILGG
ncbi:hypothetical protein [Salipaludibacillus sp. CF4.18]|uniref:hypothetical protein n=1 Tax=Salipaludibacillus sp. CF4.18 TaxID=3373081 RepID=UPI003EE45331